MGRRRIDENYVKELRSKISEKMSMESASKFLRGLEVETRIDGQTKWKVSQPVKKKKFWKSGDISWVGILVLRVADNVSHPGRHYVVYCSNTIYDILPSPSSRVEEFFRLECFD